MGPAGDIGDQAPVVLDGAAGQAFDGVHLNPVRPGRAGEEGFQRGFVLLHGTYSECWHGLLGCRVVVPASLRMAGKRNKPLRTIRRYSLRPH